MPCLYQNVTIRSYPLKLIAECGCGWTAVQEQDGKNFPHALIRLATQHSGLEVELLPRLRPRLNREPAMACHGIGDAAECLSEQERVFG